MKDVRSTEEVAQLVRADLAAGLPEPQIAEKLAQAGWARGEALDFVRAVAEGDLAATRSIRMSQVWKQVAWGVGALVWGTSMLALGLAGVDIVGPWMFAGVGLQGFGMYRLYKAYQIWRAP